MMWVVTVNDEENHIVKSLSGLGVRDVVSESDYRVAERTVRTRFFVGLMNQMEESIHRFNVVMGIDESKKINRECMDKFFGHGELKSNANPHPKVSQILAGVQYILNDTHRSSSLHTPIQVDESDPAWQALAERNVYDVRLYEEVVIKVFDEQRKFFKSHAKKLSQRRRRPIEEDEDG